MSYVKSRLAKGERVFYWGKVSWRSQWLKLVLVIAFGLAALGGFTSPDKRPWLLLLAFAFALWAWLVYTTTELAVTNKRLVAKFGLIRRHKIVLRLEKLETVEVNQSPLGRLLNYGSVVIAGRGIPRLAVPYISCPKDFSEISMDEAASAVYRRTKLGRPGSQSRRNLPSTSSDRRSRDPSPASAQAAKSDAKATF